MFKILMILPLLVLASCVDEANPPPKIKVIKEIYACDRYAVCSVKFEDGTFNQGIVRPIIGVKFKCTYYSGGALELCKLYRGNK